MWLYVIFYAADYDDKGTMFGIACAVTALTMFALGAISGRITKQNWVKQGLLMTMNGTLATGAAYFIGWGLEEALGLDGVAV